ncbi:MAG: regulatory protein RecX [Actinophytocola sp.]|uniref:regulatory protein RecX n=1 Tax=Actinophytocola sp. TaxID=1872138 RepID=UPI001328B95B|nr:regulatory protein RecX [Actinophytocola sp.]MPZ83434.1 regulatory protein RecX [Actinophytocola sp.]
MTEPRHQRRGHRRTGDDSSSGERRAAAEQVDAAQRAKDICLRLLTVRPRTRAELRQALLRKEIEEDVADQVLSRLDEVGLVDDSAFAEVWVRSRHTHQGIGRRALATELRRKGVDDAVAAEAVATVDAEAEEERARQLVRKRIRTMADSDDAARIRKLVGMLARRDYSEGLAFRVVRDELRAAGEDSDLLDGPG